MAAHLSEPLQRRSFRRPRVIPSRALIAALILSSSVAVASADDDGPPIARQEGLHLGIGVESTLAGVAGLSVRYGLGPLVGVEAVVAVSHGPGSYIPGGSFGDATVVGLAARALVPLRRTDHGTIGVVAGLDLGIRSQAMTDRVVHPALEAGLRGEYFLVPSLSLSLEVGAVIDAVPDQGRVLMPERAGPRADGTGTSVTLDNTALAGGAGLTFWFR